MRSRVMHKSLSTIHNVSGWSCRKSSIWWLGVRIDDMDFPRLHCTGFKTITHFQATFSSLPAFPVFSQQYPLTTLVFLSIFVIKRLAVKLDCKLCCRSNYELQSNLLHPHLASFNQKFVTTFEVQLRRHGNVRNFGFALKKKIKHWKLEILQVMQTWESNFD